jgi:hypothetical protein
MWGARGPFPPVAAMVVAVVMPVVFCAKATETCNEHTKISCLYTIFVCITIYYWVAVKIGLNSLDLDLDRNKHRINLE